MPPARVAGLGYFYGRARNIGSGSYRHYKMPAAVAPSGSVFVLLIYLGQIQSRAYKVNSAALSAIDQNRLGHYRLRW
jgi:hypothetical protein